MKLFYWMNGAAVTATGLAALLTPYHILDGSLCALNLVMLVGRILFVEEGQ